MITRSPIDLDKIDCSPDIITTLKALTHLSFRQYSDKGANGHVFFGLDTMTNQPFALKVYYWGGDPLKHPEPARLAELRNEAILPLLNSAPINGEWAYFVTPYCEQGDLDHLLADGIVGNKSACNMVLKVLAGASSLHASGYVHRDLKPSNIFIAADGTPQIGDLGSVGIVQKEGYAQALTKHSIIYRPPEDFDADCFYPAGDLYQLGILLFQLLGGYFPYDEAEWLTKRELIKYQALSDPIDQQLFANTAIEKLIRRGKILDMDTLPPWVPITLKRIVRKATNPERQKRYSSASEFMTALSKAVQSTLDWQIVDEKPTLLGPTSFQIKVCKDNSITIEKKKNSGWRKVTGLSSGSLAEAVQSIEEQVS